MDRPARIRILAVVLFVVVVALAGQAMTAGGEADTNGAATAGVYPGRTLITVQSYGWFDKNNGQAFVVAENGTVVWRYDPPASRVFDAEQLPDGNMLVAVATYVPAEDCPEQYQDTRRYSDHCVRNRVVELDYPTKTVVWNYSWYDAFIHWHEVHDVDRLPSGETAIIDMGNNRAFTVDQTGTITWSWSADDHIGQGTAFWDEYVPEAEADAYRHGRPEGDWTHMNDIDRLPDGDLQLSIRNFDTVLTVNRTTNEIVGVTGAPGQYSVMREQHDPHRIASAGTMLIADSKNNRVVEVDTETGDVIWSYTGGANGLQWPRDADRLPNGNTLIVDSRNFRVLEIDADGRVVWEYGLQQERGIVYDADRLSVPEEPDDVPSGRELTGETTSAGWLVNGINTVEAWAGFVFPPWVRFPELVTILLGLVVGGWLGIEVVWFRRMETDESV